VSDDSASAWLVRYGEIGLKGGNRREFEGRLLRNLRLALRPVADAAIENLRGRLLIRCAAPVAGASVDAHAVAETLRRVCGVTSFSPAVRVAADFDAIAAAAIAQVEAALARRQGARAPTFRIESRRADKRFPLPSMELDRKVGAAVLARFPDLKVRLEDPELVVGIEVRTEGAYLFHERIRGPGGLPVGSLGRALALLSGGIDSPVAAFLAMKRGLLVHGVFFHAAEFTGHGATEKVKRLARELSRFEPRFALHLVPFAPVQVAIKDAAESSYRTILYRRMMHRIAAAIARREHLAALVTGDNLGQVASQTLENLELTAAASDLPLLRPLLTYDKEETVLLARAIGTYEISIVDEPDCCTLFQPPRPRIRGDAAHVAANEERLAIPALIEAALAGAETWLFHHGAGAERRLGHGAGAERQRENGADGERRSDDGGGDENRRGARAAESGA
jgi:tRNA uracil 4-sulfurtransferase